MTNLFSSFDPITRILSFSLGFNWLSVFILTIILPQSYWLLGSHYSLFFTKISGFLSEELEAVFGTRVLPGTIYIYLRVFFFLLFSNFMGLIPYIFTRTRHLVITLALSLPLWLGSIFISVLYQYNNLLAHLVPSGTPAFLMPIIVVIETVRNLIRPATLAIRLAANMVAGHLLLTLLGSQGSAISAFYLSFLLCGLILLLFLEMAVACIQSYVFTVLSSLYLSELMNTKFNKFIT